ncbi:LytTR family transcriptional regulator DNA-binding domain-containing protein [Alteromonas sp. 1_MG-2023]|uniref:LytTR family transcriptional regulator DNA-binding domain-containing protein n=1 Tax=Alteromonas sp. 1_MG-2023 TaxID=3062669 RepID=UPI0026E487D4|nr:LytTR family transcriptional regulator DNA-binding domain-containing protein [Alteromonas sp. 1_MG-2023]MDO6566279.1 LytTR family transcriptional regulator DNA-binding domain-containing protein [Alteromonas sp. 1_MG-2023]
MGRRDEKLSQFFRDTERYHQWAAFLLLVFYLFVNNSINAASDWTELTRDPNNTTHLWEPYLWEYTSALATALMVVPLILLVRKLDGCTYGAKAWLVWHFVFASLFSLAHVTLMVTFRETGYLLSEKEYDFGPLASEFFYEYRKDLWGYITLITFYYIIMFSYRRLIGEASIIREHNTSEKHGSDEEHSPSMPNNLLVKKLNKEFLVKLSDVYWIEASGNYINLHTIKSTFPLRYTMKQFCEHASEKGFVRVHRSYAIQSALIDNIRFEDSGDGIAELLDGTYVSVSRRYKEALKARLTPTA